VQEKVVVCVSQLGWWKAIGGAVGIGGWRVVVEGNAV
jgi:hypothetical protein